MVATNNLPFKLVECVEFRSSRPIILNFIILPGVFPFVFWKKFGTLLLLSPFSFLICRVDGQTFEAHRKTKIDKGKDDQHQHRHTPPKRSKAHPSYVHYNNLTMARRYDSSTTTFSPEGRLHQVEYAIEAINNAGTCVGILAKDGVVMASEKRVTSGLLAPSKVSSSCEWHGQW